VSCVEQLDIMSPDRTKAITSSITFGSLFITVLSKYQNPSLYLPKRRPREHSKLRSKMRY